MIDVKKGYAMNKQSKWIYLWALLVMLLIVVASLLLGTIDVPALGAFKSLLQVLGLASDQVTYLTPEQTAAFWYLRMPRILVGLLVGGALALAGTVMQGLFSNLLADPGVLGLSSGAGLGAIIALVTGAATLSYWAMPALALVGAFVTLLVAIAITLRGGRINPSILLLAGLAVSLFCGALTSGLLTTLPDLQVKTFLFWMIGGLEARHWSHVAMGLGPILVAGAILLILGRQLNVMALGDVEAKALGLPVTAYRVLFIFLASILTATAVCMSGTIGFVGLVVPHIMRRLVGPDHRRLLPAAAIGGASFLVACDTLGRLMPFVGEVRVGVVTALIGAPYFLYLLYGMRKGGRL